jgi:hypothetical protein
MLRVVRSTSAKARLDAAAQFLETRSILRSCRRRYRAVRLMISHARWRTAWRDVRHSSIQLTELLRAAGQVWRLTDPERRRRMSDGRASHVRCDGAGELAHFAPVAKMPGFPALARTIHELRLAGWPEKDDSTARGFDSERSQPSSRRRSRNAC